MDKSSRTEIYDAQYEDDYEFESVMVAARRRLVIEVLDRLKPRVVVEIGCGLEMLAKFAHEAGIRVEQWIVVEPSSRFCEVAMTLQLEGVRIDVIQGFFEDSVDQVLSRQIAEPDLIICSGMLLEAPEPDAVLQAARILLAPGGCVHVNVPNGESFHRRLAVAMGITQKPGELSDRNRKLLQYRVYDFEILISAVENAGFKVIEKGGYFLKPFTHEQMSAIRPMLPPKVLDGLWQLGREMPELASEIYVNIEVV